MAVRFVDSTDTAFLERSCAAGTPVFVFGASAFGRVVLDAAKTVGLTVAGFCDNNPRLVEQGMDGVPVVLPEAAAAVPDSLFLVAIADRLISVLPQLKRLGMDGRCLTLGLVEIAAQKGLPGLDETKRRTLEKCLFTQRSFVGKGGVWISKLILTVTERCTLRCRDCITRIPYFERAEQPSGYELKQIIDAAVLCVDGIYELYLQGGDSLLHPELVDVVTHALTYDTVYRVGVLTNAIVPVRAETWGKLRGRNIAFYVSDYGRPQQDVGRFVDEMEALGFEYHINPRARVWSRVSVTTSPNTDAERNHYVFLNCIPASCPVILGTRLTRCGLVASAVKQGSMPYIDADFVDLSAVMAGERLAETREAIRELVFEKEVMPSCAYCTGRVSFLSPEVEPAVQLPPRS